MIRIRELIISFYHFSLSILKNTIAKIKKNIIAKEAKKNELQNKEDAEFIKHNQKLPIRMRQIYMSCENSYNKRSVFRHNLYAFVTIIMVALALGTYKIFVLPKVYEKHIKEKIKFCEQENIIEVKYYNLRATKGLYDDIFINHNYKIFGLIDDVALYIKDDYATIQMITSLFKTHLDNKKTKQEQNKKNPQALLIQYEIVTLSNKTGFITTSFVNQNLKTKKQSMWIQIYFDSLEAKSLSKQIECISHYLKL